MYIIHTMNDLHKVQPGIHTPHTEAPFGVVVCKCEEVIALSSRIIAVPVRQLLLE